MEYFMADMAQIDRIISEVNALKEKEKILFFHKIKKIFESANEKPSDEISIESAFGLWEGRNITKGTLRNKAWMKN